MNAGEFIEPPMKTIHEGNPTQKITRILAQNLIEPEIPIKRDLSIPDDRRQSEIQFDTLMDLCDHSNCGTWYVEGSIKGRQQDPEHVIPFWKLEAPTEGMPHSKMYKEDDKMYNWCPHHHEKGMWTLHKPVD
jgi:hypothetical protein